MTMRTIPVKMKPGFASGIAEKQSLKDTLTHYTLIFRYRAFTNQNKYINHFWLQSYEWQLLTEYTTYECNIRHLMMPP